MSPSWRMRAPQITVGLLLGAIVVWLWNGWQVGLTAVLAGLIIGVVAAPSRQRCARCEAGEPPGHQVEHVGLQVDRPALRLTSPTDQSGLAEHLEVLGHGLQADVVRLGQIVHGGVTAGQPSNEIAPGPSDNPQDVLDAVVRAVDPPRLRAIEGGLS